MTRPHSGHAEASLRAGLFAYEANLAAAGTYHTHDDEAWPPGEQPDHVTLDLAAAAPPLTLAARHHLAEIRRLIDVEWRRSVDAGAPTELADRTALAAAVRDLADELTGDDREAARLRASALESGHDAATSAALAALDEEVTVVAGRLATWFGKVPDGRPSAFACRRHAGLGAVVEDVRRHDRAVGDRLRDLHVALDLRTVPSFVPTEVFFMAGEGDLHPKHIAYFLPDDEGVRGATDKRTYYFANTHRRLLEAGSTPLATRHLDLGVTFAADDPRFAIVPVLGVLAHEVGHSVRRPETRYGPINTADRWASVVLQEVAADVFGTVIAADVWATTLGVDPADVVVHYLAECLRYASRGLGCFPDSDGMVLQLAYLVHVGALAVDTSAGARLVGDPGLVLAGLRSLARVLADAALTGDPVRAVALHRRFGPGERGPIAPLLAELSRRPLRSVAYVQDHVPVSSAIG